MSSSVKKLTCHWIFTASELKVINLTIVDTCISPTESSPDHCQ